MFSNTNNSTNQCSRAFLIDHLFHSPQLKCRFSGSCDITVESRRQCTFCRLNKCFDVQMRKDWIRTEEERQLRQLKRFYKQEKYLTKHSQISIVKRKTNCFKLRSTISNDFIRYESPILEMSMYHSSSNLTVNDYSLINNINKSYDKWALNCNRKNMKHYSLQNSTLIHFLNDEKEMFRSLIDFYKQIPEFKRIDVEDQILLIKCNLENVIHIHHVLKDQFIEDPQIGVLMSKWTNPSFHCRMSKTRHFYDYFFQHPILLKLTLVVMIFTINLSRLPQQNLSNEFVEKDSLIESQNFYVTLLWKYFNVIFDEKTAIRSIELIVCQYLRYQSLMNEINCFILKEIPPNEFHPLTKSVLCLT